MLQVLKRKRRTTKEKPGYPLRLIFATVALVLACINSLVQASASLERYSDTPRPINPSPSRALDKVEICQSTLILDELTVQEKSLLMFTSPKPPMAELPSTIRSWQDALKGRGKIIVFANDEVTIATCRANDIPVLCVPHTDEFLPRFDYMMSLMQEYGSRIVGFVNSDITIKNFDPLYEFLHKSMRLEILQATAPHQAYESTGRYSYDWFAVATRNDIVGKKVTKHTKGGFDFWAWNVGAPLLPFDIPPFRFPLSTYDNWMLDMVNRAGARNAIDVSEVVDLYHFEHEKIGGSSSWSAAAMKGVTGVYLNKHIGHSEPRLSLLDDSPHKELHHTWQFGTPQEIPYVATKDGKIERRMYWTPRKDFHCEDEDCRAQLTTLAGTTQKEEEFSRIPMLDPQFGFDRMYWNTQINWRYTLTQQLKLHATHDKYVLLTAVNFGYREMLMNFLCTLEHVGMRDHVLIAAMDERTYRWGVLRGLPIFLPKAAQKEAISGGFGSNNFKAITKLKSAIVLEVLEEGCSVVWSDVDITWFVHPFHALSAYMEEDGIAIQSNAPMVSNPKKSARPHETVNSVKDTNPAAYRRLNSGLYVAPSNDLVILAFRQIVQHAAASQGSEQPSFDEILCNSRPSKRFYNSCIYRPKIPLNEKVRMLRASLGLASQQPSKGQITVDLLDRHQFPNGAVLVGDDNENVYELGKAKYEELTRSTLLCAHNNWIAGEGAKVSRMKDAGWWHVKGEQCTYKTRTRR